MKMQCVRARGNHTFFSFSYFSSRFRHSWHNRRNSRTTGQPLSRQRNRHCLRLVISNTFIWLIDKGSYADRFHTTC